MASQKHEATIVSCQPRVLSMIPRISANILARLAVVVLPGRFPCPCYKHPGPGAAFTSQHIPSDLAVPKRRLVPLDQRVESL